MSDHDPRDDAAKGGPDSAVKGTWRIVLISGVAAAALLAIIGAIYM